MKKELHFQSTIDLHTMLGLGFLPRCVLRTISLAADWLPSFRALFGYHFPQNALSLQAK